jgi:quinate dehydrogenase
MPHSVSLETPANGIMATMTVSSSATTTTTTSSTPRTSTSSSAPLRKLHAQLEPSTTNVPNVDHLDRHGYLFGQKITASLSPLLHDVVYQELGLNWAQVRLDSTDMDLFLKLRRDPRFYGE